MLGDLLKRSVAVDLLPCRNVVDTVVVGIGKEVHLNNLGWRGVDVAFWQFLRDRDPLRDSTLVMLGDTKQPFLAVAEVLPVGVLRILAVQEFLEEKTYSLEDCSRDVFLSVSLIVLMHNLIPHWTGSSY